MRESSPDPGWESGNIHGKVVGAERAGAGLVARIPFTSVTDAESVGAPVDGPARA
jgi:hypothetical protein